ncbi:MAG TPA: HAD family hydrolase [Pilimelia sp.]|nr:HAD family hydrolase [Pilimelia sp.]
MTAGWYAHRRLDLPETPAAWPAALPQAVVVDLDGTLYPQAAYLRGAARAAARAADSAGLSGRAVERALRRELSTGSDRGGAVASALASCGVPAERAARLLPALAAAFVGHRPRRLPTYPGAVEALAALRLRFPVACLTDGTPAVQRAKLVATGLRDAFDAVVISDELGGRAARKPHPAGLLAVAGLLGLPVAGLVLIGDRPSEDVALAAALGAASIRVRTGAYAHAADSPAATVTVEDFAHAAALLLDHTGAHAQTRRG